MFILRFQSRDKDTWIWLFVIFPCLACIYLHNCFIQRPGRPKGTLPLVLNLNEVWIQACTCWEKRNKSRTFSFHFVTFKCSTSSFWFDSYKCCCWGWYLSKKVSQSVHWVWDSSFPLNDVMQRVCEYSLWWAHVYWNLGKIEQSSPAQSSTFTMEMNINERCIKSDLQMAAAKGSKSTMNSDDGRHLRYLISLMNKIGGGWFLEQAI